MNEFISLKDYFAAKALAALIISQPNTTLSSPDILVQTAYLFAEKMLELKQQQKDDLR